MTSHPAPLPFLPLPVALAALVALLAALWEDLRELGLLLEAITTALFWEAWEWLMGR